MSDTVRARGRVVAGPAPERASDVERLLGLLERGDLDPVTEVVGGHKVGNLFVRPQQ